MPDKVECWDTRAVVIGPTHAGFDLSDEAVAILSDRGHREPEDLPRDDPNLVDVVRTLGERVGRVNPWTGDRSILVVIEIPADVDWTVQEYDGAEWVAERHRRWDYRGEVPAGEEVAMIPLPSRPPGRIEVVKHGGSEPPRFRPTTDQPTWEPLSEQGAAEWAADLGDQYDHAWATDDADEWDAAVRDGLVSERADDSLDEDGQSDSGGGSLPVNRCTGASHNSHSLSTFGRYERAPTTTRGLSAPVSAGSIPS